MEVRRVGPALAAAIALVAAGACSKEVGTNAQPKSSVGAKIDRAIDRTQEKLERAGEKAKEEISEASDKTQETLSKAGEKITTGASKAVDEAKHSLKASDSDAASTTTPASTTTTLSSGPATSVKSTTVPKEARDKLGDAAITASIKADFLKDPDLSVLKIEVDTRDGVVTLNGLAENEAAKTRAERMAGSVKGVREVHNDLTVQRV
jgi:hyperosmotically inducible protein